MINLKGDNECVVCGRCAISCPVDSIHYELGKHGNYFPVIDKEICVKCHVCEQVCAKKIDFVSEYLSSQYYIGYYKNTNIREKSSSGGIFSALALYVLKHKGEVIGASFDKDTQSVKHIAVSRKEDLWKLRKSKYVQSDWNNTYKIVKDAIRGNKWILVSGTPCQIAAMEEYFGSYEKIFFVDLFCHGVTMAGIFQDYIHTLGEKISNIDFRFRKPNDDINFTIRIMYENGNIMQEEWGENVLCQLFVNSCTLKRSCLSCKYAAHKHKSDITIGDFANFREYALSHGIDYPLTSVISINSEKGMKLFQAIQEELIYCKLEDADIIASYYKQHEYVRGIWGYEKSLRNRFNKIYLEKGFSIAAIQLLYQEELELIRRIDELKNEEDSIILYGAGIVGKRMMWIINSVRTSWNIKCFVETKKGDVSQIKNVPIVSLKELSENYHNDLIIVAVSNKYIAEIVDELEKNRMRYVV